jgi:NifU-like protein involved in Fe-S cluster formation
MYNAFVMDHVLNPRNAGPLEGATHIGLCGIPGDGRYIKYWLKLDGETIVDASYECHGCPASIGCASLLVQLAKGKTLTQARQITGHDLVVLLRGLPEGKEAVPDMAVQALVDIAPVQEFV